MYRLHALKASAGTGKTYSLTVRYISLLFMGANPSNIVALTFTKKAANEMKERIFKTLEELENKDELKSISELCKKEQAWILKQKAKVQKSFLDSHLHIETIDAFLSKILRKFSLHLGIMSDFSTTDSSHEGKLRDLFIKQAFSDKLSKNALLDFMTNEDKKMPNLFELFNSLYEKSKELDFNAFSLCAYPSDEKILDQVKKIEQFLQKKAASATAVGMFRANDLEELVKKSFWSKESLNYRTFSKVYEASLDEMFFELKALYKEFCEEKENYVLGKLFLLFKIYEKAKPVERDRQDNHSDHPLG